MRKIFLKIFHKPIDKMKIMCYNIRVVRNYGINLREVFHHDKH